MKNIAYEINFDGIAGPSHNYGGLSFGNIASEINKETESNPKAAALQGLAKMKFLADLGIGQGVLPPHERPFVPALRNLGFYGSDSDVIKKAFSESKDLITSVSSSAAMWTANAATITPSVDSNDIKVHITPANLCANFHRSIETLTTAKVLQAIFNDPRYFIHHSPLISSPYFSDEGAANHSRFASEYGEKGTQLFVFGKDGFSKEINAPHRYPARQTLAASKAISRLHKLDENQVVFARQNPLAIDEGVFHNDVVATGNLNVLFCHEKAFFEQGLVFDEIRRKMANACQDSEFKIIEVREKEIPLKLAIDTYLFNSQIITLPNGKMALIAPKECFENSITKSYLETVLKNQIITDIHYLDLRQSMRGGGGPACLRLRVVLNEKELAATSPSVFLDAILYQKLVSWVERRYRDKLKPSDLADPALLIEVKEALDELTDILHLGSIYSFQH